MGPSVRSEVQPWVAPQGKPSDKAIGPICPFPKGFTPMRRLLCRPARAWGLPRPSPSFAYPIALGSNASRDLLTDKLLMCAAMSCGGRRRGVRPDLLRLDRGPDPFGLMFDRSAKDDTINRFRRDQRQPFRWLIFAGRHDERLDALTDIAFLQREEQRDEASAVDDAVF